MITPPTPAPSLGLLRRIAAGIGAQGLSSIVVLAAQLLSVPVLLAGWGAEVYADWLLLSALAGLLLLADFGIVNHLANTLRATWACGDEAGGRRLLQSGLGVYAALTGGLVAGAVVVIAALDVSGLIGVTRLEDPDATLLLLLLAIILQLPCGLLASVHSARGVLHREVGVLALLLAAFHAAPILVALTGGTPLHAAAAQLGAILLVGWGALLRSLRGRYGGVPLRPLRPTAAELRVLAAKAPLYAVPRGGALLLVNAPVLLLGWLTTPAAVVTFTALRTYTGVVRQTANQIAVAIGLEMALLHARGDRAGASRLYADSISLIGCAAGLLVGAAWTAGPAVFALWTHGMTPFDPLTAAVFLAGALLRVPAYGALAVLRLVDRPGVVAASQAAEVATALLLAVVLIPWAGAAGAALAFTAAEICVSAPWLLHAAGRLFGGGVSRPAARATAVTLAALALSLVAMLLAGLIAPPTGAPGLAVFALLWAWAGLLAPLAALTATQRAWLQGWVRRCLPGSARRP